MQYDPASHLCFRSSLSVGVGWSTPYDHASSFNTSDAGDTAVDVQLGEVVSRAGAPCELTLAYDRIARIYTILTVWWGGRQGTG